MSKLLKLNPDHSSFSEAIIMGENNKLISPSTINMIQSLAARRKELARQANVLPSMMISIGAYMLILTYIFNEDSILGERYGQYMLDSSLQQTELGIQDDVQRELGNIPEKLDIGRKTINNIVDNAYEKTNKKLLVDHEKYITEIKNTFIEPDSATNEAFIKALDESTDETAVSIAQAIRSVLTKHFDEFYNDPRFPRPDTSKHSIAELFQEKFKMSELMLNLFTSASTHFLQEEYINEAHENIIQQISDIAQHRANDFSSYLLRARFLPELLGAMSLHWLFVQPLVNFAFPYGLTLTRHPKIIIPKNLHILNSHESNNLCTQLQDEVNNLENASSRARSIARYLMLGLLVLNFVLAESEWSPLLWMMTTALITLAGSNLLSDWQNARKKQTLKSHQKRVETVVEKLSKEFKIQHKLLAADTPSENRFELKFQLFKFKGQSLSSKHICRAVKASLIANNITLSYVYHSAVILPASQSDSFLQPATLSKIIEDSKKELENYLSQKQSRISQSAVVQDRSEMAWYEMATSVESSSKSSSRPHRSKLGKKESKEKDVSAREITSEPDKKIVWTSGTYEPSSKENRITPVRNGNGNHFTLMLFKSDDKNNSQINELYGKFHDIITTSPQFVKPRGAQGLKRSTDFVKDGKNKYVPSSVKAKTKGTGFFAQPRALAYTEKSKTGEVLHIFSEENILFKHS